MDVLLNLLIHIEMTILTLKRDFMIGLMDQGAGTVVNLIMYGTVVTDMLLRVISAEKVVTNLNSVA